MANFFEIKIPVRKNEGWNDWAKNMRSKIKAAGCRWSSCRLFSALLHNLCSIAFSMRLNTAIIGVIRLKRGH